MIWGAFKVRNSGNEKGHLSVTYTIQRNTSNPATETLLNILVQAGNTHFLLHPVLSLACVYNVKREIWKKYIFDLPCHPFALNNTYTRTSSKPGLCSPKPTACTRAEVHLHTNILKDLSLKVLSLSRSVLTQCFQKKTHQKPTHNTHWF